MSDEPRHLTLVSKPVEMTHVREVLKELRAKGILPPASVSSVETARERAREIIASLPPDGIYWHGRNGRPCPCPGCIAAAIVKLNEYGIFPEQPDPVIPKGEKESR